MPADEERDFGLVVEADRITPQARRARANAPDEWTPDGAVGGKPGAEIVIPMPALRRPRAGILVNDKRLDRLLIEASVLSNSYFSADSFRVTLALDEGSGYGPPYWADTDEMVIEVMVGFSVEEAPTTSLIVGRVDDVELDLAQRQVVLSGRDFSADLLETKTTEKWPNRTASQIAEEIAGRHGLTPVVTDTTTLVGRYYQAEHARLTDETTEWNLLTYLAEQEGMDVFVRGRELHFEPPPAPETAQLWRLNYTGPTDEVPVPVAPVARLQLRRSLTLARDITVKVVSWHARQKRAFTVTRNTRLTTRSAIRGQFGQRTAYVFRLPGLTEEQAIREAETRLADLTRHHRVIYAWLPGHAEIDTRTIMEVSGTGTSFDQKYRVDEIERRVSQNGGFDMTITARNQSPGSEAAL